MVRRRAFTGFGKGSVPTNVGYARNPRKSTTDYTDFTDIKASLNHANSFNISDISAIRGKILVFLGGF